MWRKRIANIASISSQDFQSHLSHLSVFNSYNNQCKLYFILFLCQFLVAMCSCYFEYTVFLDDDSKYNIENETSSSQHENQMYIL